MTEFFCIALQEGSNLDEATKIRIKNIAQNKGHWGTEVRMDPIVLEQTLRRFTLNENQTSNIPFNQIHRKGHHMGNWGQKQRGRGGYGSAKGRSVQQGGCFRCGSLDHWMREFKTNCGTEMGNGRRGEQTYRGNSDSGRRFQLIFQATSSSLDMERSGDGESQAHQSNFAQTDESIETSPCFFADQGEIQESRKEKRDDEFQLDIIVDSGAARSTMSLKL